MASTYPEMTAPPAADKLFRFLLLATEKRDYEAYILAGTDRFQQGITREMFEGMCKLIAPRLKTGHTTEFLTEIKQCEHGIYLWKLSFIDGGNEYIARLAMTREGKVGGFMLN